MRRGFQHSSERVVGVAEATTLTVSAFEHAELKATHIKWEDGRDALATECEVASGYVVYLLRRDLPSHPYWVDDQETAISHINGGQFLLLDLRAQHAALVSGAVDCVSVFTNSDALQRFQAEHDLRANGLLAAAHGTVFEDQVITHLCEALLPAIGQPRLATELYVSHVALALISRLLEKHGLEQATVPYPRGGLASWQLRRAKDMLLANLNGRIGLETLAAECRLSRSHFARAFKRSTGASPLRWLTLQRIECVKSHLERSDFSIDQIAGLCGFADASHLGRSFVRATGRTPGEWRRARRY